MKKNYKNLIPIAAVLAVALPWMGCKKSTVVKTTTSMPTGPVELILKWPEGRRMVQSFDLKQGNEIQVPGMPTPMKQDMTMEQKYRMTVLKDRPDGKHEVEFEFLDSHLAMKMGEKVMIDTGTGKKAAGGPANAVAGVFDKLAGAKIRFLLDTSNRVEKVEGVDELQSRLGTDKQNDPTGVMGSMFKEDYFKQMMDHGRSLPPKPVSPGDTWPVQWEIAMGDLGTLVMDFTYTFDSWQKRNDRYCARIGIEGTVKTKPGQTLQTQGMSIVIKEGTSTGETWFDLDAGMFVDTVLNQDMKLNITVPNQARGAAPNAPKTQNITSALNQAIKIKLESVK